MKKILLIATGGTISSTNQGSGLEPTFSAEDILKYCPALKQICEIDTNQLFALDSANIRPQMAVDHFIRWAKDIDDISTKKYFYPDVDKTKLFELGYIAKKSSHTRGSTVDLTLFNMKTQTDIDMGGTFDYFGNISWSTNTDNINDIQKENRKLLRDLMVNAWFTPLKEEWWHFTLENEPFPNTYLNFPVSNSL